MDEWFWTIGLGPALARLQGTGPSGSAPPVVDAGHFVWEEAAGEYESIVLEWATSGHRDAVR